MKQSVKFLSLTGLMLAAGLTSCIVDTRNIKGQGPVVQQTFDLPPISGVALSIDAVVIVTQGDSQTVVIEGQQNIIANIEKIITADGIWRIGFYNSVKNHAGITIRITTPHFDYGTISGSGLIQTNGIFADTANVYLNISGSGSITLNTLAQFIESEISGSGQIYLSGSAYEHSIDISGSGNVRAFNLATERTFVRISGSGNSEVMVEDLLNVTISGSGSVYYLGNPIIEAIISGSGGIYNANN